MPSRLVPLQPPRPVDILATWGYWLGIRATLKVKPYCKGKVTNICPIIQPTYLIISLQYSPK